MILSELQGVKRFHGLSEHQFVKMLRRMGVSMRGGRYGKVFTHPSWNYVYKVFDDDPHYLAFVNYAISHPNPHYPAFMKLPMRLHKFHRRSASDNKDWVVVKIEKLEPIRDQHLVDFIVENLERGMSAWRRRASGDVTAAERKRRGLETQLPDGSYEAGVSIGELFERYPWYESLCEAAMAYVMSGAGEVNDIHEGNFLQRKDGTIVMIDPSWAGYNPFPDNVTSADAQASKSGPNYNSRLE